MMKITSVDTIGLKAPLKNPWKASGFLITETTSTIVRITTDTGLTGHGECLSRFTTKITSSIVDHILKPILIGRDPFDVEIIWNDMFNTMRTKGHSKGFFIEAMSGVDIALWDLMGKALQLPVYKLLGGKSRDTVEAYASALLFHDRETLKREANRLVEEGYTAIKMKVGLGLEEDLANILTVRSEVGPTIKIMVDANSGFRAPEAILLSKAMAAHSIYWFEEPVPPDDIEGYTVVGSADGIPLAAGESEFTRFGFRDLITRSSTLFLQPDVARAGGITECVKIATLASTFNRLISPHIGASGAICAAASLQLAAFLPHFTMFEDMIIENPLRTGITKAPLPSMHGGLIPIPDTPGMGIEIDESKLSEYRE